MLDLVTSFSSSADNGVEWLLRHAPRTVEARPDRDVRTSALRLAGSDARVLLSLPGGDAVVAAWQRRHGALSTYRQMLAAAGIAPGTVLADLLHLHHVRVAGPDLDRERRCLHLARSAALSRRARSTSSSSAA